MTYQMLNDCIVLHSFSFVLHIYMALEQAVSLFYGVSVTFYSIHKHNVLLHIFASLHGVIGFPSIIFTS